MIKKLCLFILLFSSCISFSQIEYEKGYVIDNSGKRTECYIRNVDWKSNPTSIEYKLNLDSNSIDGSLKEVAEFGIDNFSKYIRANIGVDRASLDTDNYDANRIPNYKPETLFLRILKDGNVVLYSYEDGSLNLYFIRAKAGKIEQLVNKPYKIDNQKVGFYQYFRQQLLNSFEECKDIKDNVENVKYNKVDLEAIFEKYYKCSGQTVAEINKNKPKSEFNLSIKPGITMNSLSFKRENISAADVDFGSKISYRLGVELEIILPFNKGKWALFLEPNYNSYSFSKEIPTYGKVKADCKVINLPLGLRHYMFLNKESKLFLNLAFNVNISNNSTASYQNAQNDIEINQGGDLVVGFGFKYKRYSAEVRSNLSNSGRTNYTDLEAKTNIIAFIFGYTIF